MWRVFDIRAVMCCPRACVAQGTCRDLTGARARACACACLVVLRKQLLLPLHEAPCVVSCCSVELLVEPSKTTTGEALLHLGKHAALGVGIAGRYCLVEVGGVLRW